MNERMTQILARMAALEDELRTAVHDQESRMFFQIKGKRVEFEGSVRAAHRQLKTGLFRWLVTNRPQNLLTGPIIYGMVIPLLMLDLFVSLYQFSCFPIYGIRKVRRADYIVFDRQHLGYLNAVEKFHCTYCAYGSGLMGYMGEIIARTEEYFCPIKHAHRILGTHTRYNRFLDYGDAADYEARLEAYRVALGQAPAPALAPPAARQRGFTLIELMIVVAIIGILASIALPSYQAYTKRAKLTEVLLALGNCKTSVSEFWAVAGSTPGVAGQFGCESAVATSRYVASIQTTMWGEVRVEVRGLDSAINGLHVYLKPYDTNDSSGTGNRTTGAPVRSWQCGVATEDAASLAIVKYLPGSCRGRFSMATVWGP